MADKLTLFKRWSQTAALGEVFVYYTEEIGERDEAIFTYARKLWDAGLVFLFQKRGDNGLYQYCARLTQPAAIHVLDRVSANIHVEPSRYSEVA